MVNNNEQRPIFIPQPVAFPAPVELPAPVDMVVPEDAVDEEEQLSEEPADIVVAEESAANEKVDDGISDLFRVDNEPDTDDLVAVDIERDILDANEDGDLSDLTEVSEDDILGDDLGQTALNYKPRKTRRVRRLPRRYPYGSGGMGGIRI